MDKVYTRWPSRAPPATQIADGGVSTGLPDWMLEPKAGARPGRPWTLARATVAIATAAGAAFITGVGYADGYGPPMLVVGAVVVGVAVAYVARLDRTIALCSARNDAIFERAGICMWLEDWSAAARQVSLLRRSGVVDIEAHYATRPEELRALRAQVIIKDVNSFAVEEAGASDKASLLGSLDQLLPDSDQTFVQWLVAFANGDRFFRSEAHTIRPDGSQIDALFTAALPRDLDGFANIIVTSLDITGYKTEQAKLMSADAQIARASRISTVGALSASIAHELNSPLAAVVANAQAALRWLRRPAPDLGEAMEAVGAVLTDATRAKDIIARTSAFVSDAPISMTPFDIVAAAREANLLVDRELRECGAGVHLKVEPGIPAAMGDVVQIQQVFTNLLLNATQAMADRPGPKEITISFASHVGGVRVDVADTGPGIDPQELERIFDPFHTTRLGGIGMGLAICRNCIDAQGGNIWATSAVGRGATFHFTLPAANA